MFVSTKDAVKANKFSFGRILAGRDGIFAHILGIGVSDPHAKVEPLTWIVAQQPLFAMSVAFGLGFMSWRLFQGMSHSTSLWAIAGFAIAYVMCWGATFLLISLIVFTLRCGTCKVLVRWQLKIIRKLTSLVMVIPLILFGWGFYNATEALERVQHGKERNRFGIVGENRNGIERIKDIICFVEQTNDYIKRSNPISREGYLYACRLFINNFDERLSKATPLVDMIDDLKTTMGKLSEIIESD